MIDHFCCLAYRLFNKRWRS